MDYQDKFIRVTGTYAQYPELLPVLGKAGIVIDDYRDGTILVYFKGRKQITMPVAAVTVLEF